jgi:hypothetical protein
VPRLLVVVAPLRDDNEESLPFTDQLVSLLGSNPAMAAVR